MTVSSSTATKPNTNTTSECSSLTTATTETDKFAALAEEALKHESILSTAVGSSSLHNNSGSGYNGTSLHSQRQAGNNIPFVGRKAEMEALQQAVDDLFDTSASDVNEDVSQKLSVICVSGPAGTGKSHLLQQLRSHVLDRDGFFLTGKFSCKNGTAYAGLSLALQDLVDQILDRDLDMGIRRKLEESILPEDAAILVEIFPSLSRVLSLGEDSIEGDPHHRPIYLASGSVTTSLKKSNSNGSTSSARNLGKSNSSKGSNSNSRRAKQRQFLFLHFIRVLLSSQTYQDEDKDEIDYYEEPIAPIVLVLDDVQWMDAPSCDLVSALVKDQHEESNNNKPFLLLATSRVNQDNNSENQIGEEMILWKDKYRIPITHLHLENLSSDDIHTILESFLGVSHSGRLATSNSDYTDATDTSEDDSVVEEDSTQSLAEIILEKTKGNAFFVIEFIKALLDQELLTYNYGSLVWKWNARKVKSMVFSENFTSAVVDLLTIKLNNQLSAQHQFTLIVATCLGGTFDDGLLRIVLAKVDGTEYLVDSLKNWQLPKKALSSVLEELVSFGFLNKTTHSGGRRDHNDKSGSTLFFFSHDLIRQAAEDFIIKAMEPAKAHLLKFSIGESILNHVTGQERSRQFENGSSDLFLGVELCNASFSHIGNQDFDSMKLAKNNLIAGEKALRESAFSSSKIYMEAGVELCDESSPIQREELYEDLLAGATEANYCAGKLEDMAFFAEKALARNGCRQSIKLRMLYFKALAYIATGEFQSSLDLCAAAVSMLGLTKISSRPTKLHVLKELIKTKHILKGHTKDTLQALPLIDPVAQENRMFALKFFDSVDPAAYVQNKNFILVRGLISLRWAVKYGISNYSANGFATYGLLQQALNGDLRKSAMFGDVAVAISDRLRSSEAKAKSSVVVFGFLHHWINDMHTCIPPLLYAQKLSTECGDTSTALTCNWFVQKINWGSGCISLQDLGRNLKDDSAWALDCKHLALYDAMLILARAVRKLSGEAVHFSWLNEQLDASELRMANKNDAQFDTFATLVHLQGHIMMNEEKEALACARRYGMKELKTNCLGCTYHPHFHFYRGVALMAFGSEGKEARRSHRDVKGILALLITWKAKGNVNIDHMISLLEAEIARLSNQHDRATQLYTAAILSANRSGHSHDAGICNERAAVYYFGANQHPPAAHHVQQAIKCYKDWGAGAVVARILETYGDLVPSF